jgi:hypothetical protein
MLRAFGRLSSRGAKGFILELDSALENQAGLDALRIAWRGGDDALFAATGRFAGSADEAAQQVLAALDYVAFDPAQTVATVSIGGANVHVSFACWDADIGLATVQLDVTSQIVSGDISGH